MAGQLRELRREAPLGGGIGLRGGGSRWLRPRASVVVAAALVAAVAVMSTAIATPSNARGAAPPTSEPAVDGPPPTGVQGNAADASCAGPVVDVDGDGCDDEVRLDGEIVEIDGARYALGIPGDIAAVGDWDCDGLATARVLRATTGEVFEFAELGHARHRPGRRARGHRRRRGRRRPGRRPHRDRVRRAVRRRPRRTEGTTVIASTSRTPLRPLLWAAGSGGAFVVLWQAGTARPELRLPVDPRRWQPWSASLHPLDAAAGAARAVALVAVAYLLLLAVLHLAAAVMPHPGTLRIAAAATPRFLTGSLAGVIVLAGAGHAGADPAGGTATSVVGAPNPPTMRLIDEPPPPISTPSSVGPTTTVTLPPAPPPPTPTQPRPPTTPPTTTMAPAATTPPPDSDTPPAGPSGAARGRCGARRSTRRRHTEPTRRLAARRPARRAPLVDLRADADRPRRHLTGRRARSPTSGNGSSRRTPSASTIRT